MRDAAVPKPLRAEATRRMADSFVEKQALALSEVVPTAAPAPTMNALRSTAVRPDSGATAQRRMVPVRSAQASGVASPTPSPVVNSADAGGTTSIGCYRVAFDSTWARAFPERFVLSSNERGQAVVSVSRSEALAADSVLVGADWQASNATTVVRLVAPERATITFGPDGVGQLQVENRTSPAKVQRVRCDR